MERDRIVTDPADATQVELNQLDNHGNHSNGIGNASVNNEEVWVQQKSERPLSLVDTCEQVTLTWSNVNVHVKPPDRICCRGPDQKSPWKHIVRDAHGIVNPGTLLAIMGASGSGKTTLLNTLTSRSSSQRLSVSSDVRVNGVNVGRGIRNISGYIQQNDLFIPTMTVREHLTFRALLRMEKSVSKSRRLKRVEEVIQEVGLTKCVNSIIGNPEQQKGISGGEMRRLSFASEILTNPPLLFCDEATSGLDSFMAENIVQTLKTMAGKGKTILCSIHQPSSEAYALFDQVMIMAEGRTAFLGNSKDALDFFKSAGYPCPMNYNPADHYIHTLAIIPGNEEECRARVETFCDEYEKSPLNKDNVSLRESTSLYPTLDGIIYEEAFSSTSSCRSLFYSQWLVMAAFIFLLEQGPETLVWQHTLEMTRTHGRKLDNFGTALAIYESSWIEQFCAVFMRCWRTTYREPLVLKLRVSQTLVVAVLFGLIYLRSEVDQIGVMNINGVIFLLIAYMFNIHVFAVANIFPTELPIFLREYGIGLYRVDVYFIGKILAEIPVFSLLPALFCAIVYFMVGLYESAEAFCICCGVLVLVANTSVSFGYLISSAVDSVNAALALSSSLLIPLIMFSGFFLNKRSVPDYFKWLEYLSWFKYSNELLTINQWQNVKEIDGCPVIPLANSTISSNLMTNATAMPRGAGCLFRDGDAVIDYLSFDKDNVIVDAVVLVILLIVYRLIAFFILFFKARRSKS